MLLVALVAALAASETTTSFPGGTIRIPAGCRAPRELSWLVDSFEGSINCSDEGLEIAISGDYPGDACANPDKASEAPLKLRLPNGASIVACTLPERNIGTRVMKRMLIDLGPAELVAEISTPRQALLLLRIATSFRRPRASGSK